MGKVNCNGVLRTSITGGLIALVVGGGGWWLKRVDDHAVVQGATITKHAVKIATTEEAVRGVREDVAELKAEVKAGLGENAAKLDAILGKLK